MRYRAMLYAQPLGPWRARVHLAKDDAVTSGHGRRDAFTGIAYLDPLVRIARDTRPAPEMTADEDLLFRALAIFRREGAQALAGIKRHAAWTTDDAERERLQQIGARIADLVNEARRDHALD